MAELYLPVLSHFQNGNLWTGSSGRMRYRIAPEGEALCVEAWEGPWSYALSRIEQVQTFPMDGEGLHALAAWIGRWSAEINARPPRSMEETLRLRDERKAELASEKESPPPA